ncbi:MAG: hypothetical protein ABIN39_03920 [candidate division WOR-3 bacterium]
MKYYSGRYDLLLREKENKKSKGIKRIKSFFVKVIKLFILIMLISGIIVFLSNKFINMKTFRVKYIEIKVVNEKIYLDSKPFKNIVGENIFKIKSEKIKEIVDRNYSDFKVKNIKKSFPSKLEIIVYRKIPLLLLEDNLVIYQDMEVGTNSKYSAANYIFVETDEKNIRSVFDVPGLPTIFPDLIREKDNIKKIGFIDRGIKIYTKNNKSLIINKGDRIPKLKEFENIEYKTIDLRFKNGIYVKK